VTRRERSETAQLIAVAQQLFRAAVYEGRPPGATGRVLAFEGTDAHGSQVKLTRKGQLWDLSGSDAETREVALDEVLRLLAAGSFRFEGMTVVPDIADHLFKHAVQQAEESLAKYLEAEQELGELLEASDEGDEAVRFALHAGALDRSIARAVTSIVLSIAAAEAQLNNWSEESGGWRKQGRRDEDRLPAYEKCRVLALRAGVTVNVEVEPWSDLGDAVRARNGIVHSKPVRAVAPLSEEAHRIPGYEQSLDARRACRAVREAMVALARILGAELPSYLAYCPPEPAEDDDAWRNASIATGMREDPDFPPVSERLKRERVPNMRGQAPD
jgi:hypothetical protein